MTEFLPISSSGHLVIAQKVLGVPQHDLAFDIVLHLGTLLSIVTLYYYLLKKLILPAFRPSTWYRDKTPEAHLLRMIVLASIPTALIGLGFKDQLENSFSDISLLGWSFIATGGILLLTKLRGGARIHRDELMSLKGVDKITWWMAILIGIAQGIAIIPAISRSGTTIVSGLLLGLPGSTAALFSFLMSLPAIAGAALLELRKVQVTAGQGVVLGVGFLTSYLFGLLGLWGTLQTVRKGRLEIFSIYLFAVGLYVLWAWT